MKKIFKLKQILLVILLIGTLSMQSAYGHKLISHDDSHRDFDSALSIPDHKISWAVYENLGANESKYYSFEAKKGDSLYASIVIPKISGLEEYSPTMILVNETEDQFYSEKFLYEGNFPGREFYEPFGQVTYWERQEITSEIPADGTYYIVVADEKNQIGKYSFAIGTIEDFSGRDFFTILPKAWFDTKLFVNDYSAIVIFFSILIAIVGIPTSYMIRKKIKRRKVNVSTIN